jgi:hypothetical protein
MKRIPVFFFLNALFLSGCSTLPSGSGSSSASTPSYFLAQNGNLFGTKTLATYADVTFKENSTTLISRFEGGEDVAFLFTGTACSFCSKWETTFVTFIHDTKVEVAHVEKEGEVDQNYTDEVTKIKAYLQPDDPYFGETPAFFVARKGSVTRVSRGSVSYLTLLNSYQALAQTTRLTTFSDWSAYQTFLTDNPTTLTYCVDRSSDSVGMAFYGSNLYSKGKTASKPLALLDYGALSTSEQALALSAFALSAYVPLVKDASHAYDITKESEKALALSLIASYFA